MEKKLNDSQRSNERLMMEKGEAVNRLSKALSESQNQCHYYMSMNTSQENLQLQARIKSLLQEKDELGKIIQELQVIIFLF